MAECFVDEKAEQVGLILSYQEACVVSSMVGNVVGSGEVRGIIDLIWEPMSNALDDVGLEYGMPNELFSDVFELKVTTMPDIRSDDDAE